MVCTSAAQPFFSEVPYVPEVRRVCREFDRDTSLIGAGSYTSMLLPYTHVFIYFVANK